MIIKTKMHWYITSVQKNNNEWIIQGIQEEHGILDCIITRTNLQDELALNIEYNEGIGLCVISHQEVYRIEIEIDNHLNKWLDRDKFEKVSVSTILHPAFSIVFVNNFSVTKYSVSYLFSSIIQPI